MPIRTTCWGTLGGDGKPVFPNASFHVAETDGISGRRRRPGQQDAERHGSHGERNARPIRGDEGQDQPLQGRRGNSFPPSASIDTAGHTPGDVSFEFAGGDGLIITGDAVLNRWCSSPTPSGSSPSMPMGRRQSPSAGSFSTWRRAEKKNCSAIHWPYAALAAPKPKTARISTCRFPKPEWLQALALA